MRLTDDYDPQQDFKYTFKSKKQNAIGTAAYKVCYTYPTEENKPYMWKVISFINKWIIYNNKNG
jgi:hypothetical protein